MTNSPQSEITVAVLGDCELVVKGVSAMLSPRTHVRIVELAVGELPTERVDVVLFDAFGIGSHRPQLDEMLRSDRVRHAVLYGWDVSGLLHAHDDALPGNFISKSCDADTLADAIVRASRGERVVELGLETAELPNELSNRELEILALIANGMKNSEIAEALSLSTETVKTYAERAYQKIGARNRTHAAVLAVELGMVRVAFNRTARS